MYLGPLTFAILAGGAYCFEWDQGLSTVVSAASRQARQACIELSDFDQVCPLQRGGAQLPGSHAAPPPRLDPLLLCLTLQGLRVMQQRPLDFVVAAVISFLVNLFCYLSIRYVSATSFKVAGKAGKAGRQAGRHFWPRRRCQLSGSCCLQQHSLSPSSRLQMMLATLCLCPLRRAAHF